MSEREDVTRWILAGKQVGARISFVKDHETHWTSVGVQLWHDKFRVYVDEIAESKMDCEEYSREETRDVDTLGEVSLYINNYTQVLFEQLRPCKGQKIFNPAIASG